MGLELKAETQILSEALPFRGFWKSVLNLCIFSLSHHLWHHNCWDDWFFLELSLVITLTPSSALDSGQCCVLHGAGARGRQLLPAPLSSGGQWGVTGHNTGLSLVTCVTMLASDWLMETCVGTIGAWSQESESFRNTLTQKYICRWGPLNYAVK